MSYELPDDRLYHPGLNLWLIHTGERVRVGLIEYASELAGPFISFIPRTVGQTIYRNRTCATLESVNWVGPVKSPCGGEIVEINERLIEEPGLINRDPYGDGWLLKLRPIEWGMDQGDLVNAEAATVILNERLKALD